MSAPKRITLQQIWENLLEILNFERGIFYTIAGLAVRPGEFIKTYFYEDRKKAVQPLKFLVIAGVVTSVFSLLSGELNADVAEEVAGIFRKFNLPLLGDLDSTAENFRHLTGNYQGLLIAFSVPLIAGVTYLIFRQSNYNYAEHLVIAAYLFGFNNLLTCINVVCIQSEIYPLIILSILMILGYFVFYSIRVFQLPLWRGLLLSFLFVIAMQIISSVMNIVVFFVVSGF